MKLKAPGLEMYGRTKEFIKEINVDIQELENLSRDTLDDLKRLKIRYKYLMKQKIHTNYKQLDSFQPQNVSYNNYTTTKKRRVSALTSDHYSLTNSQMISQDVSISQISHLSNNSYFFKKQESEKQEESSETSSESESSSSSRSVDSAKKRKKL